MKKLACLLLTVLFAAACLLPAADAVDVAGHWAEPYFRTLSAHRVINPNGKGEFTPNSQIGRVEFMRYINRAFGFTQMADISKYTDVKPGQWYYDTVRIAVQYGYISGLSDTQMNPEGAITREQAITILGRLCKLETAEIEPDALPFRDSGSIADWSAPYIDWGVQSGYVSGYTDGTFQPKRGMTRAEAAKILYTFLGTMMDQAGQVYTGASLYPDVQNALVSKSCTLRDLTIPGNLIISEGVGGGAVSLVNVTVQGRLVASGGNITLDHVTADQLYVGPAASTRDPAGSSQIGNIVNNGGTVTHGGGTPGNPGGTTNPGGVPGQTSGIVNPSYAQFSPTAGNPAHQDVTVKLIIDSSVVIQSVAAGNLPLTLGTQYTIQGAGNEVVLFREALAAAAAGQHGQMTVSFSLSDGRVVQMQLGLV